MHCSWSSLVIKVHRKPKQIPCIALQDEQRAERQAAKAAAAQLSVRDKTTFASRQQALFTDDTVKAAFHETLQASKKASALAAGL